MNASAPMRVLHVGKFYAPVEGGIESVVKELATGLRAKDGVRSSVLVAQRHGPGSVDEVDGVPVHRVRSAGVLLGTPLAPSLAATVERLAPHFDVVHVHVPNPLPFFCDWERVRRGGTKLIVHHHSDIVRPIQQKLMLALRSRETRMYSAADAVVVTSQRLLDSSATLQPHRDKCRVLPLSIDTSVQPVHDVTERAAWRKRLGYSDDDAVFFFLGRLVYYKGVADLLRAAAGTSVKVLIGGGGPLRKELENLCRELNLCDRVQFLGRISDAELPSVFGASDVFVLPSNAASEAFGVVQLEAMLHGLPVLNTDLPTGVPEVSLHGVSGLTVPPGDVKALARAMQQLADDAALRTQFACAARERVSRFDRKKILAELHGIYREVAELPIRRERSSVQITTHLVRDHHPSAGDASCAQ